MLNRRNNQVSIFGSTGYIGSNFCKYKEENNESILKVKRNDLRSKSDKILYMISTNHNYNVFDDPHLDINTNLNHLISVLEENKNSCKEFNFLSSWFVYGNTDLPAKETSQCNPTGFYSITKKCAEDLLISYCKTFNMNYRIIRLCNVYGSVDKNASSKKNALHYLVEKVCKNEDVELYENGDIIRDYMHVEDVCAAIDIILEKGRLNEIYNIGNGSPIRIKDLIETSVKITKSKSNINSIEQPVFHKIVQVKDMYLDNTKLETLGFKQKIEIRRGIELLCNQFKKT